MKGQERKRMKTFSVLVEEHELMHASDIHNHFAHLNDANSKIHKLKVHCKYEPSCYST